MTEGERERGIEIGTGIGIEIEIEIEIESGVARERERERERAREKKGTVFWDSLMMALFGLDGTERRLLSEVSFGHLLHRALETWRGQSFPPCIL